MNLNNFKGSNNVCSSLKIIKFMCRAPTPIREHLLALSAYTIECKNSTFVFERAINHKTYCNLTSVRSFEY